MIRTWLHVVIYFVVFVLLQVLVLNNIHLFGIVVPFIYVYVMLKLPVDMTRSGMVIISFLLGLVVDMFSNTFGIHAAACSFAGFVRAPLLERFVDMKDLPERSVPSYKLFGYAKFIRYALLLVALHHIMLFIIEAFTFFQLLFMITKMTLSIFFSLLLILITEAFNLGKQRHGE